MKTIDILDDPKMNTVSINANDINNYPIKSVIFNPGISYLNFEYIIVKPDRPLVYGDNYTISKFLGVDKNYYINNKEIINNNLINNFKTTTIDTISIEGEIFNTDILKAIVSNPNIKRITVKNYILTT